MGDDGRAEAASQRRIMRYGVLAGMCPLVPIPLLDDALVAALRKRMIKGQLEGAELEPAPTQVNLITHEPTRIRLAGCLIGAGWYLIKKVLRKLLFVFMLKECVDNASRVLHHGWLFQHALSSGTLGAGTFEAGNEEIKRVRDAVRTAADRVDTRPLNQVLHRLFRGSKSLMTSGASALGRMLRSGGASRGDDEGTERAVAQVEGRQVGEVERILDEMAREMGAHGEYLRLLEEEFERAYEELEPSEEEEVRTIDSP